MDTSSVPHSNCLITAQPVSYNQICIIGMVLIRVVGMQLLHTKKRNMDEYIPIQVTFRVYFATNT